MQGDDPRDCTIDRGSKVMADDDKSPESKEVEPAPVNDQPAPEGGDGDPGQQPNRSENDQLFLKQLEENRQLQKQVKDLSANVAGKDKKLGELEKRFAEIESRQAPVNPAIPFSDADQEVLGELAEPLSRAMGSYTEQIESKIAEMLNPIMEAVGGVKQDFGQTKQEQYRHSLDMNMGDLRQITQTADWQRFRNQPLPFTNGQFTMGDRFDQAQDEMDLAATKELHDAFLSQYGGSEPVADPVEKPTPRKAPTQQRSRAPESGVPEMSQDSYDQNFLAYRNGEMTQENWEAFKVKYDAAYAAGQVTGIQQY